MFFETAYLLPLLSACGLLDAIIRIVSCRPVLRMMQVGIRPSIVMFLCSAANCHELYALA